MMNRLVEPIHIIHVKKLKSINSIDLDSVAGGRSSDNVKTIVMQLLTTRNRAFRRA